MDDHIDGLRRARQTANLTRNRKLYDALTAAIEALEAGEDAQSVRLRILDLHTYDECVTFGGSTMERLTGGNKPWGGWLRVSDVEEAIGVDFGADAMGSGAPETSDAAPARMSTEDLRAGLREFRKRAVYPSANINSCGPSRPSIRIPGQGDR